MPHQRTCARGLLRVFTLSLTALVCLGLAPETRADEIAIWNFNDSNTVVDRGAGTLTTTANPVNITFPAGTTVNAQGGDPAGQALAIAAGTSLVNNGSLLTFNASTAGFTSIVVSYAWQRTTTGFSNVTLQYSTDGLNFSTLSALNPPSAFDDVVFTFDAPTGAGNNPLFAFRFILDGATGATGNIRIDNFAVTGSPIPAVAVPEPVTMLIFGTGLAGAAARVRRRRKGRAGAQSWPDH